MMHALQNLIYIEFCWARIFKWNVNYMRILAKCEAKNGFSIKGITFSEDLQVFVKSRNYEMLMSIIKVIIIRINKIIIFIIAYNFVILILCIFNNKLINYFSCIIFMQNY